MQNQSKFRLGLELDKTRAIVATSLVVFISALVVIGSFVPQ